MRYATFEKLVSVLGSAAILGALALSYSAHPDLAEALAQVLLVAVLVSAVHWGRKGGTWAALGASLAYLLIRLPLVTRGGLDADVLALLLTRFATFGLVGIAGGELCGRIKYIFASLESGSSVDEWTRVYNQAHAARLLETMHGQHARYGAEYSLVVVEVSPGLTAELRPTRQRVVLKAVADHIRNGVRLVDEVARLDDGRFVVMLPHTGRQGALVVAERVRAGVRDTLGAKDESVRTKVMGCEEDAADLVALRESIAAAPGAPQAGSGS